MALIAPTIPRIGQPNSTEDANIVSALNTIVAAINGGLDSANIAAAGVDETNLTAALATRLGVGTAGRGKSIVTTEEGRTNAAYGLLATPDRVSSVAMPSSGLIFVAAQAEWKAAAASNARAAVFVGATQMKVAYSTGAPVEQAAILTTNINTYTPLFTTANGLYSGDSATAYTGDVTTGQMIGYGSGASTTLRGFNGGVARDQSVAGEVQGGVVAVFAAAGTYDVSLQFMASSGCTVKNRKLWVWTMGF